MSSPPASWLPMRYPRRGGFPAGAAPVAADADTILARELETNDELLQWASWDLVNDPEPNPLVTAARRYRDGDVTPVGAAALVTLLTRVHERVTGALVVDGWVARHGLTFAAQAVMEASDLRRIDVRVPFPKDRPGTYWVSWVGDHPPEEALRPPEFVTVEQLVQSCDLHERMTSHTVREDLLDRMRVLLSASSDDDYTTARDAVGTLRTNRTRRLATAFLFPTERGWFDEVAAEPGDFPYRWRTRLLVSVSTPEQLAWAQRQHGPRFWLDDPAILAAVVDGVGADLVPILADAFDTDFPYRNVRDDAIRLGLLDALAAIPTDDAFAALVERAHVKNSGAAVHAAMRTYPRRALRVLARSETGASALFDRHVLDHPDLAVDLADTLPDRARRRIAELTTVVPEATDLPALLVTPRWADRRKPAPPVVLDGLTAPPIRRIDWLPGELEELRNSPHAYSYTSWDKYRRYITDTSPDVVDEYGARVILLLAPDEIARPVLTEWPGTELEDPLRVVARYGLDALPLMLQLAHAHPNAAAPYLAPYTSLDIVRLQATQFATRKNLRKPALAWLVRHADDAVTLLVPDAVGPTGPRRDHAIAALRALARATTRDTVVDGARKYGAEAAAAVAAIVDLDPLDLLPTRIPRVPVWADLASLPPILTADRSAALPDSAVSTILTMCAVGTVDAPYAGLDAVTDYCDRASLGAAMWMLFERWWAAGAPAKDNWIVLALGWLGDDAAVTNLAPLIRRWPGEGGTARAQLGLDALAAHGSPRALTELDRLSRKVKFKSLRNGAADRVAEVADRLGLDREQLADRTVPDLDLSSDDTTTFDYGSRSFTVEFTEALVPVVVDESGKRTSGLPKTVATDDADRVADAKKRFAALKRETKTVAGEQLTRLTRAMVTGRRWNPDEFTEYLVGHPLLVHAVRGLVWASFDEGSRPVVVFRVGEDDTFVDLRDVPVPLPDAPIGLVHPAHLPDTAAAWSDAFARHGIRQPFPQLDRAVHDPLPGDVDGAGLSRFTGATVSPSRALRLTHRGWEPVWENPSGWGQGLRYRLSDTVSVLLGLDPGMGVGDPYNGYPDQTLVSVALHGGTLADVDRATVSELLADLSEWAS
ncbi:DUF4132 domain-containing protein [Prescottella sp. R16]|uniref:DUF4132 domain-containing protein n=1 Tax=Prescottella sp. R16 TaxID=3064529 RepID=UPI00272E4C68|nr:DUF4132 domain-containing protein [Prescottella sp. R16]